MRVRGQKRNLNARLAGLEGFYEAALAAANRLSAQETSDEAIAAVRAILASRGVQQEGDDSLMEALARALDITSSYELNFGGARLAARSND